MDTPVSAARGDALIVVFAEDDCDTREMYQAYFSECGVTAEFACDGQEAVAKIRLIHPDVVVLDITLPSMDGFAVCRAIKWDPATSAIPVIAATGYWRPGAMEEAQLAGFESYLLKPYAPDRLLAEIRRLAAATSRGSFVACLPRTSSPPSARRTGSRRT